MLDVDRIALLGLRVESEPSLDSSGCNHQLKLGDWVEFQALPGQLDNSSVFFRGRYFRT